MNVMRTVSVKMNLMAVILVHVKLVIKRTAPQHALVS